MCQNYNDEEDQTSMVARTEKHGELFFVCFFFGLGGCSARKKNLPILELFHWETSL